MNIRLTAALFVLGFSFLGYCSSPETVSGGEAIEGWKTEGDVDVFYMKMAGRASEKAIERNDYAMKKTTCIESTQLQAADRIVRRMYGETLTGESQVEDGATAQSVITSARNGLVKGTSVKECAPVSESGDNDWTNCECVHFVRGRNLKKEFEKLASEFPQNGR